MCWANKIEYSFFARARFISKIYLEQEVDLVRDFPGAWESDCEAGVRLWDDPCGGDVEEVWSLHGRTRRVDDVDAVGHVRAPGQGVPVEHQVVHLVRDQLGKKVEKKVFSID